MAYYETMFDQVGDPTFLFFFFPFIISSLISSTYVSFFNLVDGCDGGSNAGD